MWVLGGSGCAGTLWFWRWGYCGSVYACFRWLWLWRFALERFYEPFMTGNRDSSHTLEILVRVAFAHRYEVMSANASCKDLHINCLYLNRLIWKLLRVIMVIRIKRNIRFRMFYLIISIFDWAMNTTMILCFLSAFFMETSVMAYINLT